MSSRKVLLYNQRTGGISRIMNLSDDFEIDNNGIFKVNSSNMRNTINVSQGGGSAADFVDNSHAIINDGGVLDLNEGQGLTNTGGEVFINNGQGISFSDLDAVQSLPHNVLVSASDAPQRAKDLADYVCDGTDDQDQINLAIQDSSGRVQLSSGTFLVTDEITLDIDEMTFNGQGNSTLIRADQSISSSFTMLNLTNDNCQVSSLLMDGNKSNVGKVFNDGIKISGNQNQISFVRVKSFNDKGVEISGIKNQLNTVIVDDCLSDLDIISGSDQTQINQFQSLTSGISIDDGNHSLTNSLISGGNITMGDANNACNFFMNNSIVDTTGSNVSIRLRNDQQSSYNFTNCSFKSENEIVTMFSGVGDGGGTHLTFTNCSFEQDTDSVAIENKSGYEASWTFSNCFFENSTPTARCFDMTLDSSGNYLFVNSCHVKGDFSTAALDIQNDDNTDNDGGAHVIIQGCFIENNDDTGVAIQLGSSLGSSLLVDNILSPNDTITNNSGATEDRNIT